MNKTLLIITQFGYYCLAKIIVNILFRQKTEVNLDNFNNTHKYIVAANHQSRLDPLVICSNIPLKVFFKLAPFRFITADYYMNIWWLKHFLLSTGCFPAKLDSKNRTGLERSINLINEGNSLFIFPEGIRAVPGAVEPKRGISAIAQETDAYIIPVLIKWRVFSFINRHLHVIIGSPFPGKNRTPSEIMNHIYSLDENKREHRV